MNLVLSNHFKQSFTKGKLMQTKKAKPKATVSDLLAEAIKSYKKEYSDWKSQTRDEMYGIESDIDALLYEKKFKHLAPNYGSRINFDNVDDEVLLERLTFKAIQEMSGRRHRCDPYYDDTFNGYDCMSEVVEYSGKEHKHSKKKK